MPFSLLPLLINQTTRFGVKERMTTDKRQKSRRMINKYIISIICHGTLFRQEEYYAGKGLFIICHTLFLISFLAPLLTTYTDRKYLSILIIGIYIMLQFLVSSIEVNKEICNSITKKFKLCSIIFMYSLVIISLIFSITF